MADEVKPPVAIRITRPHLSEDEYLEREFDTITRTSVVLVGAQSRPQGVILRFEVVLASGISVLRGEGRVVAFKPEAYGGEPGLTLRFTRLDSKSKALVDRAAALREARIRAGSPPSREPSRGGAAGAGSAATDGPPVSPSFLAPSALRSSEPPPAPRAASSRPPPLPRSAFPGGGGGDTYEREGARAPMRARPTPPPLPPSSRAPFAAPVEPVASPYDSATFASSPFPDPAVDPFPPEAASVTAVTEMDLESTQVEPLAMAMRETREARSEPPPPASSREAPVDFDSVMVDLSPLSAPMHMPSAPPPPPASTRTPSFPPPSRNYPLPAPSVPPPPPAPVAELETDAGDAERAEVAQALLEDAQAHPPHPPHVPRQPFLPAPESDPYAVDVEMDRVELHDDLIAAPPPPPARFEPEAEPEPEPRAHAAPLRGPSPLPDPVPLFVAPAFVVAAPAPESPVLPPVEPPAVPFGRNGSGAREASSLAAPPDRAALLDRLRRRGRALSQERVTSILQKRAP